MLLSDIPKKSPPDCASGPALTVDPPLNWSSGAVVVLVNSAACLTPNVSQQAEPRPRLVVSNELPFVAEKSGPDSMSLVGFAVDRERRRLRMSDELTTLA
jgi:hypothetical protein